MTWIRSEKTGCIIELHVQPQARKNEIVCIHNNRLKVKIKSPPVDGKANESLIEFIAETLGLRISALELIKGETSRQKQILVHGVTASQVETMLLKRIAT
jgi:uncharacterized protein (TIGR00251 family)